MLFNSYLFLFAFLPTVLLGFFALGRRWPMAAAAFLAGASLAFYAAWDWRFLPILLASVCANYLVGAALARAHDAGGVTRIWLTLGVAGNLLTLAYFKYADFFLDTANRVMGTDAPLWHVVLPLGISFFTFTQIAYLVDAARGFANEYNFVHYVLFVTYFPHLIAGPIIHHRDVMPQFVAEGTYRPRADHFAVGLTLFTIGLFKKVAIADSLPPYVHAAFEPAAGAAVDFSVAWCGALAYAFQIYFDFSGYSDMAIGLSRMFGITLPANFLSPYQATSIVDFWRRWHVTLSTFLRDYLYVPLGGNRHGAARRYLNLLITMLLGGLWHGASWLFIVWGGLHGLYLAANHAWIDFRGEGVAASRLSRLASWAGTFIAVVIAWVFFRASSWNSATTVLAGMAGLHGWGTPNFRVVAWLAGLLAAVTLLPNALALVARYHPPDAPTNPLNVGQQAWLRWSPTPVWSALCIGMLLASLVAMAGTSEFLYFQF